MADIRSITREAMSLSNEMQRFFRERQKSEDHYEENYSDISPVADLPDVTMVRPRPTGGESLLYQHPEKYYIKRVNMKEYLRYMYDIIYREERELGFHLAPNTDNRTVGAFRWEKSWFTSHANLADDFWTRYREIESENIQEILGGVGEGEVFLVYNYRYEADFRAFEDGYPYRLWIQDNDRRVELRVLRNISSTLSHLHSTDRTLFNLEPEHEQMLPWHILPFIQPASVGNIPGCSLPLLATFAAYYFNTNLSRRIRPRPHTTENEVFVLALLMFDFLVPFDQIEWGWRPYSWGGDPYYWGGHPYYWGGHPYHQNSHKEACSCIRRLRRTGRNVHIRFLIELIAECVPDDDDDDDMDNHPTSQLISLVLNNQDGIFTRAIESVTNMEQRLPDNFVIEQLIYPMFASHVTKINNDNSMVLSLPDAVRDDLYNCTDNDRLVNVYNNWDEDDLDGFVAFMNEANDLGFLF